MNTRLAGGILLIAGTTIGGAILALPLALAEMGFIPAVVLLVSCWLAMTTAAMLLLEVTLWFPRNSHLVSMAGKTLGPLGVILTWFVYLLLLYSLVSAYISGGTDLLQGLSSIINIKMPAEVASIIFTILLSVVIWCGIRAIDIVNRGLMFIKLGSFLLLVFLLIRHMHMPWLKQIGAVNFSGAMLALTSFGFSVMIPSLRNYFHDDIRQLKIAIYTGSAIPLLAYLLWVAAVMGVIPRLGSAGSLTSILHHDQPVSMVVSQISILLHNPLVTGIAHVFTSICVLTSFLGVGLCLADFLADGFKVEKKGLANLLVCVGAMLPPLLLVLFWPDVFILLLGWAGALVVMLVVVIPACMVWRGRYRLNLAKENSFKVFGGKATLIILLLLSVMAIFKGVFDLIVHIA